MFQLAVDHRGKSVRVRMEGHDTFCNLMMLSCSGPWRHAEIPPDPNEKGSERSILLANETESAQ